VIDTTAHGDTAEVSHQEVVEQERDMVWPDVVLLVHVYNPQWSFSRWNHRVYPLSWVAPTFGVGLNTGSANGRFFGGASIRLGSAAAVTGGIAGGKVKRLSAGVNRSHLADGIDPEASRVDVFKTAWFVSVSWRR
jgi:hypothetical protein